MHIRVLLLAASLAVPSVSHSQQTAAEGRQTGAIEYESPYGFCFSLPEGWKGFSTIYDRWQGYSRVGGTAVTGGPVVVIRNPKWSTSSPHQDIPIIVFTLQQWQSLGKDFVVTASGVAPNQLGRNSKYVFAIPARYNYSYPEGWQEVDKIIAGHPLHSPPCGKTHATP